MKGNVQNIILQAQIALQDAEGTRWPAEELVAHLSDGERAIAHAMPGETALTVTHTCTEGARQVLPDDAMALIEVIRNTERPANSVSKVSQEALEASVRGWQGMRPSRRVAHYMHTPSEPRVFLLYPPPIDGLTVELTYSQYPADLPTPTGPTAADVSGNTSLEARWDQVLLDYVLYKAWLKDSEGAANAQKAGGYLSTFTAALGLASGANASST